MGKKSYTRHMAIQSWNIPQKTTQADVTERSVDTSGTQEERNSEHSLRPSSIDEYIGQESIKWQLRIALESAKIRNTPLEHVLLYGPPGLWKTTLSMILASEMWAQLKHTSWPAIEKQSDIVSLLTWLQEWDILFIDEIHRLRSVIEEILYTAMEDFCIDVVLGTGTWAQSVRVDLPPFTLVWATTKLASLSSPLRDRFWNVLKLDFYDQNDLATIAGRTASKLSLDISEKTTHEVARRSRGTPRIVNRFMKILRDYQVTGRSIESKADIDSIFWLVWVDEKWLDELDRMYLGQLFTVFHGWPVGIGTLASIVGEDETTLEEVVEPYLLKIWFLERSARWRKLTSDGEAYIGGNI